LEERCYGRDWQNAITSRITRGHSLPELYQTAGTTKDTKITKNKKGKIFMETQKKDRKAVVDKSSDSGCGGLTRSFGQTSD
jgi:hypothetical protein